MEELIGIVVTVIGIVIGVGIAFYFAKRREDKIWEWRRPYEIYKWAKENDPDMADELRRGLMKME